LAIVFVTKFILAIKLIFVTVDIFATGLVFKPIFAALIIE
jgi:hypothetical protein